MPSPKLPFGENLDHEALLFERYKQQGKNKLHYCPKWDGMVIHEDSTEFEACKCDLEDTY